jgi:hypothetical protein
MAAAVSRRSPGGCYRGASRPRGALRADRSHLPGLRDRPAGPAGTPARRAHLARRPRIPRQRGSRHAGLDRRIGQQRRQTGARQPAATAAACRRPRTAPRLRFTRRGRARGEVRPRLGVRRSRCAGGPANRRRLHVDAADALRIRRPRRRGPLLRRPVRRGPQVRPGADARQRPAGVRGLPARPWRHPPRDRPLRPDPQRRPDLRHDPLREQRPPMVRATAIAPKPAPHPGRRNPAAQVSGRSPDPARPRGYRARQTRAERLSGIRTWIGSGRPAGTQQRLQRARRPPAPGAARFRPCLGRITADRKVCGVGARRAAPGAAWSRCHLVRHWLRDRFFELAPH